MGVEAWITLAVVGVVTLLLVRETLGPDLSMFSGLAALVLTGVLEPADALIGFSRPEVATIAVLFVTTAAIQETGALVIISRLVFGTSERPSVPVLRLMVPVAALSAFINNTPIVAVMVPVVRDFAQRIHVSPSRLLMPLSYAAMLGGTCTLIGTSANLVVSSMLQDSGQPALGMFELTWVGLPTAVAGVLYMMTLGRRLLADTGRTADARTGDVREYLAEMELAQDSPLCGRSVQEAGLRALPGLFLVELRRAADGAIRRPVAPEDLLRAGDLLVFTGVASSVSDLRKLPGLLPHGVEGHEEAGRRVYEVVLSPTSPLVGTTLKEANFRRRYNAAVLAVHRSGHRIAGKIGEIVLQPGDVLMVTAQPGFRTAWKDSPSFYMVSRLDSQTPPRYRQANLCLAILGAMVLLPALDLVPMLVSALGALVLLLATGCITPHRVRSAVQGQVLVVIASALGISQALASSGAADAIGGLVLTGLEPLGPLAIVAGVYVLGVTSAALISNAAGAAFVFPVAVAIAESGAVPLRPLAIAIALAASAAFATPLGYQNLLVYGPGGYRYTDFLRVGLPLNALLLVVMLILLPWAWPLA